MPSFGWVFTELSPADIVFRAASQAVLLLFDKHCDESMNELLQTRLFALLVGEKYRSHAECLFVCDNGAGLRTGAMTSAVETPHAMYSA